MKVSGDRRRTLALYPSRPLTPHICHLDNPVRKADPEPPGQCLVPSSPAATLGDLTSELTSLSSVSSFSNQIPGWGPYYMNYKFLKKIINSLVANRPASELAALVADIRPPPPPPLLTPSSVGSSAHDRDPLPTTATSPFNETTHLPGISQIEIDGTYADDDGPLPPGTTPPTPGFGARGDRAEGRQSVGDAGGFFGSTSFEMVGVAAGGAAGGRSDEGETLRAHRTVFFFKLEREIEKVRPPSCPSSLPNLMCPSCLADDVTRFYLSHRSTRSICKKSETFVCVCSRCSRTGDGSSDRPGRGEGPTTNGVGA